MKALLCQNFGTPSSLSLKEVATPIIGENQVSHNH
jgi:NADPH:quinone reductase-like Zn-dependent oxidoreductase